MDDSTDLRVSKRDNPDLYELIEEALVNGDSSLELQQETFEIVSAELSLADDAAFLLVKL